jgi:hypothetical protein
MRKLKAWLYVTLESPDWQNTTVLAGDVGEAVSRLKQQDGEDLGVLELAECRPYDNGVVSLTYQPTDR